jgi:ATP-dependent Clp protease protease subunit
MTPDSTTRPRIDDDDDDEEEDCEGQPKGKDVANFLGKSLLEQRIIMVSKAVDREMAAAVVSQLLILDNQDTEAPITMYVNCPGGDADSGFGIYDVMRYIKAPVTTVCLGLAASAAVIIFVGGEKGRRYTLPNSRFLIHQPSSHSQGQASDIEITANEIMKTRDLYNRILAAESNRTEKQILKDVSRDFWLSADEAVEYGIASSIITTMGELPKA